MWRGVGECRGREQEIRGLVDRKKSPGSRVLSKGGVLDTYMMRKTDLVSTGRKKVLLGRLVGPVTTSYWKVVGD